MNNFEVYYDNPRTYRRERLVEGEIIESMSIQLLYEKDGHEFIRRHMGEMWLFRWEPGKGRCP